MIIIRSKITRLGSCKVTSSVIVWYLSLMLISIDICWYMILMSVWLWYPMISYTDIYRYLILICIDIWLLFLKLISWYLILISDLLIWGCIHIYLIIILINQYEAKMSTLNETIKDIDSKKKQLQETVDSLNDQVEMLKMEGTYCYILKRRQS